MNHDVDTDLVLADGTPIRFGHNFPDTMKFAGAPAFDSANPVLKESEWEEHDDLGQYMPDSWVEAQQNSNCTNASLATLARVAFTAAGVADVPRFSWSFLYSLNNGGSDNGASCRDLAQMFRDGPGMAPVSVCPDSHIYEPRGGYPQSVIDEAKKWIGLEIYQCFTFEEMMSAATLRFGVYFGISLGRRAFFNTGSDGVVPDWDGSVRNGHAMWVRGITKKFGAARAIVPNTWGPSFGNRGIGYMPRSYFWAESGRTVNLDAYAVRAVKRQDPLPTAATTTS